jgi:hypothetical protein
LLVGGDPRIADEEAAHERRSVPYRTSESNCAYGPRFTFVAVRPTSRNRPSLHPTRYCPFAHQCALSVCGLADGRGRATWVMTEQGSCLRRCRRRPRRTPAMPRVHDRRATATNVKRWISRVYCRRSSWTSSHRRQANFRPLRRAGSDDRAVPDAAARREWRQTLTVGFRADDGATPTCRSRAANASAIGSAGPGVLGPVADRHDPAVAVAK